MRLDLCSITGTSERLILYTALVKEYGKPSEENIDIFIDNFFRLIRKRDFHIDKHTHSILGNMVTNEFISNTGGEAFFDYIKQVDEVNTGTSDEDAIRLIKIAINKYSKKCKVHIILVNNTEYSLKAHIDIAREELSNILEFDSLGHNIDIDDTIMFTDETLKITGFGVVKELVEVEYNPGIFDLTSNKKFSATNKIMRIELRADSQLRIKEGIINNMITTLDLSQLNSIFD